MVSAGIDIGSRTIKLVLIEDGEIKFSRKTENTFNTIENCKELLKDVKYDSITATGYGRHLFNEYFGSKVISEIKAFTKGTHFLFPNCRTILDIGGQDTKAIAMDSKGRIKKFEMNDKCAAGTGRFLEIMAMALRFSLQEFGDRALESTESEKINCMCTVFAESEVISQLARGADRKAIAKGILQSVVNRSISQMKKIGISEDVVFVGGVAFNSGMVVLLEQALGFKVYIPEDPQIVGAIGAALEY
ncbi:MAG: acyl-CoA dehydratase activase [Marinifilaceae bacterium]